MNEPYDTSFPGTEWAPYIDPNVLDIEKFIHQYQDTYRIWQKRDAVNPRRMYRDSLTRLRREWLEWHGGDAGDLHDLAVGIEKELP